MTDDDSPRPLTDAQLEAVREAAREEAEAAIAVGETDDGDAVTLATLRGLGLSRQQALLAGAYLLAGAGLTAAVLSALSESASATHGGGTLGTSSDPLDALHTDVLQQSPSSVDADVLHIDGNELTIASTPSSPESGDVRITQDS